MSDVSEPSRLPEDAFLTDFAGTLALDHALRSGVIDRLAMPPEAGSGAIWPDRPGTPMLRALLLACGVLADDGLSPAFRAVLAERRDILEAKLAFLRDAAADILTHGDDLFTDLGAFQARSRTFAVFRYDHALSDSRVDLAATRPWVRLVEALSRAEVPFLVPVLEAAIPSGATRVLEVGGNTGILAEALMAARPGLEVTILDLPAVCALGRLRTAGRANGPQFVAGDARTEDWPLVGGARPDVILFKSVLHDWPHADQARFLTRSAARLAPGGRIIIAERIAPEAAPETDLLAFHRVANLVFAPFYRSPETYCDTLRAVGLGQVQVTRLTIDAPFMVVTAGR